jgi:L-fuconolactonase
VPDFPIIDSHLHIYDPGRLSFPWMEAVPKLNSPHLPDRFRELTAGVQVEKAVFVEVDVADGSQLAEAEFISEIARGDGLIGGMVVSVRLDKGAKTQADLDAVQKLPLTRGVRHLIERHLKEPGWAVRDAFVEGVQSLAGRGLGFDLCLYHPQLGEAIELVRRCPDVRFVLDHIGKPGIRAHLSEPWRSQIAALARLPNVCCKISGVVTEADHGAWTEKEVAPYVAHAIDVFGFDRVMFGGDWPVSELATTYARWVALVDSVVAGASAAEKRRLFRDNAIEFYSLGL